jgi:hypothetical protein
MAALVTKRRRDRQLSDNHLHVAKRQTVPKMETLAAEVGFCLEMYDYKSAASSRWEDILIRDIPRMYYVLLARWIEVNFCYGTGLTRRFPFASSLCLTT